MNRWQKIRNRLTTLVGTAVVPLTLSAFGGYEWVRSSAETPLLISTPTCSWHRAQV